MQESRSRERRRGRCGRDLRRNKRKYCEKFVATTRKHWRQTYRFYIHIENETNTDRGVNVKRKSVSEPFACRGAVARGGPGASTHNARSRNQREEVNRYWTLRGEGGLTDTYHGVKEFQNSLGVADTRRHRDTERQDRLLHRYLPTLSATPPRLFTSPADRTRLCWLPCVSTLEFTDSVLSPFALEQHNH